MIVHSELTEGKHLGVRHSEPCTEMTNKIHRDRDSFHLSIGETISTEIRKKKERITGKKND